MSQAIFSVQNRKAIVTGGRRGLGRAMTEGLLSSGANVTVVSREPLTDDLVAFAKDTKAQLHWIGADLLDHVQRVGLCARASVLMGGLDILVNNAGLQMQAPLKDYQVDTFRNDYSLMVEAPFDLSRQAATLMSVGGSIVNVSSISGFQGARNISGYATAKHAVIGLTKCLANELAPHGIRVNCLAPGLFNTDMASSTLSDPKKRSEMLSRIPSGRFGEPTDIVGPLLFLCSDAARHVHGTTLLVDGGWMGR